MNGPRRSLAQYAADWALGIFACFGLLVLMAWMEHKQSETEAMRLTAKVVDDRAAEHAAMRGPR